MSKATGDVSVLGIHKGGVSAVRVSPSGEFIFSAGCDGRIKRWKAGDDKGVDLVKLKTLKLSHGSEMPYPLAMTVDERWLVCGMKYGVVDIFDAKTGKLLRSLDNPLERSRHEKDFRAVAIHPKDRDQIAGTNGGYACVWNGKSGEMIWRQTQFENLNALFFLRDGAVLFVQDWNPWLGALDWPGGKRRDWRHELSESSYNAVTSRALPDGKKSDGKKMDVVVSAVDADGGHLVGVSLDSEKTLWQRDVETRQHDLAFTPDGKTVVAGGDDGVLRLFDVRTKKVGEIDLAGNDSLMEQMPKPPDEPSFGVILTTTEIEEGFYEPHAIHTLDVAPNGKFVVVGLVGGLVLRVNL